MNRKIKSGFTLVEVTAAMTLTILAVGLAVIGYMFTMKNANQADIQNDLDIDVQLAMEHLKIDIRLSSLDKMFYFPEGGSTYEAVSFPKSYDSDGDGIMEKDSDGSILWDETVIYHIRPTTPHQLVKTTFKPRDNSLTDTQRQAQLEAVVDQGVGDSTYNGVNATSSVIFENLLHWTLSPKAGEYDAYSAKLTRDRASLGYVLMDSGDHDVTFTVAGKNNNSDGYKIGIDQLFVSSSQSPREAEAQLPVTSESGATAASEFMPVGSWKGSYQLKFPATDVDQSFTLTIPNDKWEETNFGGTGYQATDTRVEFDEDLSPSDHVVMLDGMDDTWEAEAQTGSLQPTSSPLGSMANNVVRVLLKGSELEDNANWFSYNGQQCQLTFDAASGSSLSIANVYIGETSSSTNAVLEFGDSSTIQEVLFGGVKASPTATAGNPIVSDWINLAIDKKKNYLVSFRIANSGDCHPAFWTDSRSSATTCMVVTNGSVATAKDTTWKDRVGIEPVEMAGIIGLTSIKASYPAEGTYSSQIIDTHQTSPQYGDISWNAEVPTGTTLAFKVITHDDPSLCDPSEWDTITPFSYPCAIAASYKRYIQFQAILTSDDEGQLTPKLKDVSIDWTGAKKLVDVGGIFTKGPDYGTFNIAIDGQALRSALIVDLEIYKDTLTVNDETIRVTSSLKAELTPRNSGL